MTKEMTDIMPAEAADPELRLPMPGAVFEALSNELDALDQIIKEKTEELRILNARYETIAKFIKENR